MAKVYFDKLGQMIDDIDLVNDVDAELEVKHFFSGAAPYADNVLRASWP